MDRLVDRLVGGVYGNDVNALSSVLSEHRAELRPYIERVLRMAIGRGGNYEMVRVLVGDDRYETDDLLSQSVSNNNPSETVAFLAAHTDGSLNNAINMAKTYGFYDLLRVLGREVDDAVYERAKKMRAEELARERELKEKFKKGEISFQSLLALPPATAAPPPTTAAPADLALARRHGPTIEFSDATVVKYQPEFVNGIRECVYYSSLEHPHIVHTNTYRFITYTYAPTLETLAQDKREFYNDDSLTASEADLNDVDRTTVYDGLKITFPRYVPVDAIADQMTPARVEQLFEQIADALAYLEENDILQSDVKEENIFYDATRDTYLLADFDLAFYTTECFINRVATPTTRPPELARVSLLKGPKGFKALSQYLKADLSTTKGDVFSLGVVAASLLNQAPWYSSQESQQASPTYYASALARLSARLASVPFKYMDVLMDCLQFDYRKRPTCAELARRVGTLRVYTKAIMIPRDDYGMSALLLKDVQQYADAQTEGIIVRSKRTAKMLTTFYSLKQLDPKDPKIYYCYAQAALILSALLCSSDTGDYPTESIGIYKTHNSYEFESSISGQPSLHEKKYGINHADLLTADDLHTYISDNLYGAIIDICVTLDFKLLF